jgi:hypothetical protein
MTRHTLPRGYTASKMRRFFDDPLNARPYLRLAIYNHQQAASFPASVGNLPLWARGANRRPARRWLAITTRAHMRQIRGHR